MIPKFLRRRREKHASFKQPVTKKPRFLPLLEQLEGRVLLNHQPPVAVLDSYETTAGAVFVSQPGVLDNDQGDGEALTALMVDPPDHGVIAFGTDGVFFYQSDPAFAGFDTFTYKAVSSAVASEEATVEIYVSAVAGGIAGSGDGSGGGCNGAGSPLGTISDLNQDAVAGALNPEGALLNIPPFTSLAEDGCGDGGSSTDTTSHADGEGNHPPIANNDPDPNIWWRIPVSQELVIAAPGVLGNDSDQDGDALQSFKVNDPVDIQDQITPRGAVTLYPNGAFRYYAPTNWAGSVNFTYVARDQHGAESSPATVRVDVLNSTPLVHNDVYSTPHGQTLNVGFPGVLANDSDNGFGSVTVEQLSGQQYATIGTNGAFSYQPPAGFVGTVFLTYRLRTAYGAYSPTATVRIDVTNRPPYAGTDLAPGIWWRIPVGQELVIAAPGVRWNDGDPDGDNYDVYKLTNPVSVQTGSQGSVTLYGDGAFRYQAPSNWFGAVTFTYRARDVYGAESYPAIVFLDVLNSTPLAVDDMYTALPGQVLNVGFPGVLANDSENGWGHVDVEQLSGQQYATIGSNGAFSYQPPAGFTGPVYLTYRLKTPYGAYSPTATVTINVGNLKLREVSFRGFFGATGIPLTDHETDALIGSPEWLDANLDGDTNDPGDVNVMAAFPRNQASKVRAVFPGAANYPGQIRAWAEGGAFGGLNSNYNPVVLDSSGAGIFTINAPANTVSYKERSAWSWSWKYQVGADPAVYTVGTSSNTMCTTYEQPDASTPIYYAVMESACASMDGFTEQGGGQGNPPPDPVATAKAFADKLFAGFEANAKVKGVILTTTLKYDLGVSGDDGSVKKLLNNGKGSCDSWARYFVDQYRSTGGPRIGGLIPVQAKGYQIVQTTGADTSFPNEVKWKSLFIPWRGMNQNADVLPKFTNQLLVNVMQYANNNDGSTHLANTNVVTIQMWRVIDHAVVMLQLGQDTIIYDTSFGNRGELIPFVVPGFSIPPNLAVVKYKNTAPFWSTYAIHAIWKLQGDLMFKDAMGINILKQGANIESFDISANNAKPEGVYLKWFDR